MGSSARLKNITPSSVRNRVWFSFHAWTVGAIALIFVGNVATALRPFDSIDQLTDSGGRSPLITISSASGSSSSDLRLPASDETEAQSANYLVEILLDCGTEKEVTVGTDVRQLRLKLADCRSDLSSIETFYVRNETNGFEATVFKVPETRKPAANATATAGADSSGISTDYISLESGENKVRISRSQGDLPSREQTLRVRRR